MNTKEKTMPGVRQPVKTEKIRYIFLALLTTFCFSCKQNRPASKMEWIGLSADGQKLVEVSTGKTFQMWGVNYDRDYKLRLMDDYWFDDWDTVTEDFDEMKEMGLNVVRIHLQFGRFMDTPTQPNMQALNQLTRLIRVAEEREMYLYVTGLGCYKKQNIPDWYEAMDEHERTAAQATFWKHLARVCASSPAVLCYDLMNEPIVSMSEPIDDWVTGGIEELYYVQNLAKKLNGRTPQEIAKPWVDTLAAAIRAEDSRHLITVGAIPLELYEVIWPDVKPLFNDPAVCENLDFISVHFYPEKGEVTKALHVLSLYDIGKPIVIAETFPISCSFEEIDHFIEASKSIAQGWISFYWGKTIEEYAQENNIGSAIMKQWLEYYKEKGKLILK